MTVIELSCRLQYRREFCQQSSFFRFLIKALIDLTVGSKQVRYD